MNIEEFRQFYRDTSAPGTQQTIIHYEDVRVLLIAIDDVIYLFRESDQTLKRMTGEEAVKHTHFIDNYWRSHNRNEREITQYEEEEKRLKARISNCRQALERLDREWSKEKDALAKEVVDFAEASQAKGRLAIIDSLPGEVSLVGGER